MIAVVDFKGGNTNSILFALKKINQECTLTNTPKDLISASKIILPGQGNFGEVMKNISPITKELLNQISLGKPFLGICVGLQILFSNSAESPNAQGLNLLNGSIKKFEIEKKCPQIGWNQIKIDTSSKLLKNIPDNSYMYFVHSYYASLNEFTTGQTNYGETFTSVIEKENIFATQFHPEKSGKLGLQILRNFCEE